MATKLSNKQLAFGVIAGALVAAGGVPLWYGIFDALGTAWMAPLLIGVAVGAAVRFVGGKPRDMRPAIAACALTVLSCAAGYILTDQTQVWVDQPTLAQSARHLASDFQSVILIALGTYFAYLFARPRLP
ncbi:MAG: hypothetical protein ACODAQ_07615 [Phycisphaeraceae bacterium]